MRYPIKEGAGVPYGVPAGVIVDKYGYVISPKKANPEEAKAEESLKAELKAAIREELKAELKAAIREELKAESKSAIREELKAESKSAIREELKAESKPHGK